MIERRFIATRVEARGDAKGDAQLVGYAAKFRSMSQDLGGFRERIAPGAFVSSLRRGDDVKCLMNHDPSMILGRVKNGTLSLSEDSAGLRFAASLPNTSVGRDAWTLVKRGDIDQCSFAFQVDNGGEDWDDEDDPEERGKKIRVRTLKSVRLLDVSAVTYPAYDSTEVFAAKPPHFNSLARAMFPEGIPAEVRSHLRSGSPLLVGGPDDRERRRSLASRILSV